MKLSPMETPGHEAEGILYVSKVGKMLYRVQHSFCYIIGCQNKPSGN